MLLKLPNQLVCINIPEADKPTITACHQEFFHKRMGAEDKSVFGKSRVGRFRKVIVELVEE